MTQGKLGAIVVGTGFGVLTHLRALRMRKECASSKYPMSS
jgi:hypothetical protein